MLVAARADNPATVALAGGIIRTSYPGVPLDPCVTIRFQLLQPHALSTFVSPMLTVYSRLVVQAQLNRVYTRNPLRPIFAVDLLGTGIGQNIIVSD